MIALSRTRGFSAGNWQILLTNNLNELTKLRVNTQAADLITAT
jgi:hypothetical protein